MAEPEFLQDNSRFDEPLADSPLPRAKPITGDFDRLQPAADREHEFDGGEKLLVRALPMAHALTVLKARAKGLGIPVIYVNDNFDRWRSDFNTVVQRCLHPEVRGRPVVALLKPDEDGYFVLKPKHSAFYQTGLEILLQYLGAKTLILTGVATDICVLFSANDAYMRDFRVCVPSDCVASESDDRKDQALALMQRVLKADIAASTDVNLERLVAPEDEPYKETARGNVV